MIDRNVVRCETSSYQMESIRRCSEGHNRCQPLFCVLDRSLRQELLGVTFILSLLRHQLSA